MDLCEYSEECKNRDTYKCDNCECNKNNFEAIEKEEKKSNIYKSNPRKYYKYKNNYDPM